MNKPFDGNRIIFKNAKQLIAFLLLTCQSINTMAGSSEEGKSFAEQLHSQGYRNQENVINTTHIPRISFVKIRNLISYNF